MHPSNKSPKFKTSFLAKVPAGARCDMEDSNLCPGWTRFSPDDGGKWARTNGKELKDIKKFTGDIYFSTDHTTGNESGKK